MSSKGVIIDSYEINCVGIDEKLHVCLPWECTTRCGIKVKSKVVKDKDYVTRLSCYGCTYE